MNTDSREEREELKSGALRWVGSEYGADRRGAARAGGGFDPAAWSEMAGAGWLGVAVPEAWGGLGLTIGHLVGIAEAVGSGNLLEPVTAVAGIVAPLLARVAAHSPFVADLLDAVTSGTRIVCLAHSEPGSGTDRAWLEATAAPAGDGWQLDGRKVAVEGGTTSDFLFTAKTVDGPGVFVVSRLAEGLHVVPYKALDGRMLADLHLEGVCLPHAARLGGLGLADIDQALDAGALLASAEAVGAMGVLFDDTIDYLRTRRQFGRPLADFQVLQHRAVDMFIALQEARAVVEAAADCYGPTIAGSERREAIAVAKVVASRAARLISREAVQMHGAVGITDELRTSHLFRRLVVTENLYGDAESHVTRFQRMQALDGREGAHDAA